MYTFDFSIAWRLRKVYIKESTAALAVYEPLTSPTKYSTPLTELNANDVDDLTTNLATELSHKLRRAEANSAEKAERVSVSDS